LIAAGILAGTTFKVAENAVNFATLVFGFLVIVGGVALLFEYSLQLNRVAALARGGPGTASEGSNGELSRLSVEDDFRVSGDRTTQKSPLEMPLMSRFDIYVNFLK
jgi:hypothetical protein